MILKVDTAVVKLYGVDKQGLCAVGLADIVQALFIALGDFLGSLEKAVCHLLGDVVPACF